NASVQLKNSATGTLSKDDGTFTLTIPASEITLVVSFIGYFSQDVDITGKTDILVALQSESTSLQDVVVVGYGTQRAEAVTGSVSSIQGDALREVPAANISQALQGRLPGVELSQTRSEEHTSELQSREN